MGATNLLELPDLPDATRGGVSHALRIYELGGALFLGIELAPPAGADAAYTEDGQPYTATLVASMRLSLDDLDSIEEGVAKARRRIGA